jgi:regulatory protein
MAVITAIVPSARKAGRFELVVDGRHEVTLSLEAIERLGLAIGRAYDAVRAGVEREAAVLATYDRALNMLAFRARSTTELRRQLIRKGESAPLVELALERLHALGLRDDASYARQFSRAKVLGPGYSKRRLQQELFRKGVSRDVADEAIAEVLSEEAVDEDAIVERVARKKLRSLAKLDAAARSRRLYAFLARRGFDSEDIRRAMRAVLDGNEEREDLEGEAADSRVDPGDRARTQPLE